MKIRRIFLVTWWFADAGGMEQHTVNLASALARREIEVVVFSQVPISRGSHYSRRLRDAGVRVISPPAWSRRPVLSKRVRRGMRRFAWAVLFPLILVQRLWCKVNTYHGHERDMVSRVNDVIFFDYSRWLARAMLRRRHRRHPADLVHVHGFRLDHVWALEWARGEGVPTVYTEHGTISDWGSLWEENAPDILQNADVIACVSDRVKRSLYEYIPEDTPVEIAPHIIADPGRERQISPARDAGSSTPFIRLICIARLCEEKGGGYLIRAMRQVVDREPDVHLTMAGDGPDRVKLERLAADLGIEEKVTFYGRFAPEELASLMHETDIVILPSLTEGLPLTIVEAMAFSKTIVATSVGGVPELIRHEVNGLLVEPENSSALALAILRCVHDGVLRMSLAGTARRDFETGPYGEEKSLDTTMKLYEKAIANRTCPGRKKRKCGS